MQVAAHLAAAESPPGSLQMINDASVTVRTRSCQGSTAQTQQRGSNGAPPLSGARRRAHAEQHRCVSEARIIEKEAGCCEQLASGVSGDGTVD